VYDVHVLIPTARFAFSVEGDEVHVLPEHRSPEAYAAYQRLRRERPVVGMTTFPNSVLLRGDGARGEPTVLVDPGLQLQNEPVLKALGALGLAVGDVDLVALTHAHDDHACACVDLPLPVAVHEDEIGAAHWPVVEGILGAHELRVLRGSEGELAPGIRWVLTPGHTPGGVTYAVETGDGVTAICGDIVGPSRDRFDAMEPEPGPAAEELLASWRRIRELAPRRLIAGHLPPFTP
jgi:glyoxylase-like metal-dependent hydrolase (beta-lactamase superfamily II)